MGQKAEIRRIIFIILLSFWAAVWWANLYKNFSSHFEITNNTFGKPLDAKWEYLFGGDLYRLLVASNNIIPLKARISFIHSLDSKKNFLATYFLYPREIAPEGEFIVVYKNPFIRDFSEQSLYTQAPDIFILKKIR